MLHLLYKPLNTCNELRLRTCIAYQFKHISFDTVDFSFRAAVLTASECFTGMVTSSSISLSVSVAGQVINEQQLGPVQVHAQPDKAQYITVKL